MNQEQQLHKTHVTRRHSPGDVIVLRYVYAWGKSYFITDMKFCPFEGSKLVLLIKCKFTNAEITTHRSPCVGDVVSDYKGVHLEIVDIADP